MVLGDHGRRVLYPFSAIQKFASFPFKTMYKNSMYFRALSGTMLVTLSVWAYVSFKGLDVWFTPYDAVHHSIGHKFAHDLDHRRYPIQHHHDDKKH